MYQKSTFSKDASTALLEAEFLKHLRDQHHLVFSEIEPMDENSVLVSIVPSTDGISWVRTIKSSSRIYGTMTMTPKGNGVREFEVKEINQ